MRPFLLIWALLTSVAGLLQSSQPEPGPFTIGVLRRDALVVPFATYNGKKWEDYWPAPNNSASVPMNVRSVPKGWWGPAGTRDTWQVWTSAAPPQIVKVVQPDWAPSYCQKQVGLRTDYQPRVWPPRTDTQPFPKDGLAVSPPRTVEPIDVLAPDSSEWDAMTEAIHRRFTERENVALTQFMATHHYSHGQFIQPPGRKELQASLGMRIEALYAYGTGRRTYFVEAAREYKKAGACLAMAFGRGFVVRDSGKFAIRSFQVGIDSCERDDVRYMLPLGVMSVPTGVYWIAQTSGWTHETYDVIDIGPDADPDMPAQSMPGGGC